MSAATRYELEQRKDGGAWSKVHDAAVTSKALSGQAVGVYDYRVRACNAGGCGSYSAVASTQVILPPAGVPTLSATAPVSGMFTLNWSTVSAATGYRLEEISTGNWTVIHDGAGTSQTLIRNVPGNYSYRVQACNAGGCGGVLGDPACHRAGRVFGVLSGFSPADARGGAMNRQRIVEWLLLLALSVHAWPAFGQQTVKYVHTDALGSVVAMTDAAGAMVETTREYEPYGQQLAPAIQDGPGYTGQVQDAATGLTYMQQRYYDPLCGCFLSVDPVTSYSNGDARYFNRYWYAAGNPYKFTDPDGRELGAAFKVIQEDNPLPTAACEPNCKLSTTDKVIIGGIALTMAAPFIWELGVVALSNPATTNSIVSGGLEVLAGDALGGAALAAPLIPLTKAAFGHTFVNHGQDATNFVMHRAAGSGKPVGQFLDDQAAARLIQDNLLNLNNGAISVPVPSGFPVRVVMPDGSFAPASTVRIVPSGEGVRTAYPEL